MRTVISNYFRLHNLYSMFAIVWCLNLGHQRSLPQTALLAKVYYLKRLISP